MNTCTHSAFGRLLASLLVLCLPGMGCVQNPPLLPTAGIPQHEEIRLVRVPGGLVNTAGGNLFLRRVDLSVDTVLGTHEIAAVYNSASGTWLWNFQITYTGEAFLDPTGHLWEDDRVPADGEAFPGSVWKRINADTLMTKGGLAYHFDGAGRLAAIAWATLDYPRLVFSPGGVEQCVAQGVCSALFDFDLDAAGLPLTITEVRTGRVASFDYDLLGRLVAARDAADNASGAPGFRYEYGLAGTLLTAVVNSEGERIEYQYQGERRILFVTQIGAGNPRHRFDFYGTNSENWPTLHTNPLGGVTRYHYQAGRRLSHVILEATGETNRFLYGDHVRPGRVSGPSGATVSLVYGDDDPVTVVEASGRTLTIEYEPMGLNPEAPLAPAIRRVSDQLGLVEERDYDDFGRPESVTNGEGEATVTSWSGALRSSVTRPDGVSVSFPSYGLHGHWLEIAGAVTGSRVFDPAGNPVASSLPARSGGLLSIDWDASRRIAAMHLAATTADTVSDQDVVTVTRRADGRTLRVERPYGGDHEFDYDALGRPVATRERADGAWRTTTFEHDAAGNLAAVELANGMRREFDHDVYGRRTAVRAYRDGVLEGELRLAIATGLPRSKSDSLRGTATTYVYDRAERPVTAVYGYGEQLSLAYDLRGHVTDLRFALPQVGEVAHLTFGHDAAGRTIRVGDGATGETLVHYVYAAGRLVEKHFGNGLVRTFFQDADGTPVGSETRDSASGEVVASSSLSLTGEIGPPRQQVESTVETPLASTVENFWLRLGSGLANPDQLAGRRVFHWDDGAEAFDDFDFDTLGNRVGDSSGNAFEYNAEHNRLASAFLALMGESVDYTYDAAGFVTRRNGSDIGWNAMGRIASHGADEFSWDMLGTPIARTVDGVTRRFDLFDGAVESDAAAGTIASLEIPGELLFDFGGDHRFLHRDFRKNVSFVSDSSGAIVAHHHYRPNGRMTSYGVAAGGGVFASRAEAGTLMLMGARVYDPLTARFLSPDPLLQLVNQYTWTLGNPLLFSDPSGLNEESNFTAKATAVAKALGFVAVTLLAVAQAPSLLAGLGLGALAATAAGFLGIEIAGITVGTLFGASSAVVFIAAHAAGTVAAVSLVIDTFSSPQMPQGPCPCPPRTDPGAPRDNGGSPSGSKRMIQKLVVGSGSGAWKPATFGGTVGGFDSGPACGLIGIEAALLLALLGWPRRRRAKPATAAPQGG